MKAKTVMGKRRNGGYGCGSWITAALHMPSLLFQPPYPYPLRTFSGLFSHYRHIGYILFFVLVIITAAPSHAADTTGTDTAYGPLTWQVSLDVNPVRIWFSRHFQLTGVRLFGRRHGVSVTPQILFSDHTTVPGLTAGYRWYWCEGFRNLFFTARTGVVPFFLGYRQQDATSNTVIYEETDAVAGFQAAGGAGWTVHQGPGFTVDLLAELSHTVFLTRPSAAYRDLMEEKNLSLDEIERTGLQVSVRLGIVL